MAAPVPVRRGRGGSGRLTKGERGRHYAKTIAGALVLLEHS
ncbi:MAG TPA: hypothetical protein VIP57_11820 [Candidatus Dormibacteraeota bacterium]